MNKEELVALGLTEEQADKALKLHKEAIDGNFVAKHRFDEVNGELKTVKEQVTERDTQIASLKKFQGDTQALSDKIKDLETQNQKKDSDYQATLASERKRNAIRLALLEDETAKPHDPEMVMGLFNLESIKVDEAGKITEGFKEQRETLKKEKAFLFNTKTQQNPTGITFQGKTPLDGDGGNPGAVDPAVSMGKSLAQVKLGMMGTQAVKPDTTKK